MKIALCEMTTGICEYHLGGKTEWVRKVYLRDSKNEYKQKAIWICDSCRKYLKGNFKYA